MTRLTLRAAGLVLALTALAGAAQAHNLWLLPSSTVFSRAGTVSVDAAVSNDLFVANHAPLRLDGLQITTPDGSALKADNEARLEQRTVFDVNMTQSGTYRIAVINTGAFARWEVTVGKPSPLRAVGQRLELISTGSPTDLVKGEKATFTLNLDGQPANGLEVTVTAGNTQYRDKLEEIKLKTDDKGQFGVTWRPPASTGWTPIPRTTRPRSRKPRNAA